MKKRIKELAAVFILSCLNLAGGPSFAAEFEVLDRFSVDGYTVLRGSADITSGSFVVGGSTFVIKGGNVGIGTADPKGLFQVGGGSFTVLSSGNVGVGTTNPLANFEVAGGIKLGGVTSCTSETAGTLRWYDGHISVCNGAAWRQLDNQAPPTITALSPDNGPVSGGTPVTITGSGFVPGPEILINGLTATAIAVVSVTQITAVTPASGTTGLKTVKLTNPDGQNITGSFTYNPLPSFSAVDPNNGPVSGGTSITINGTGFVAGASITIDATMFNATFINDTRLTAVTPAGSLGLKNVTVTNPDKGLLLLAGAFTYNALPVITSPLSPNNGRSTGGNAITINGSGFVSGAAVKIGGNSVTGLSISASQITGTTPAGVIGSQTVTVTNPDSGYGELAGGFTYNPLPTVTSVSPASGPQATVITITGTDFAANPVVTIAGATVNTISRDSATQIRVLTHTSTTSGAKNVTVTNPDNGAATKTSGFTYTVYATGGTESVSGSYRIHTFTTATTPKTFTVNTGGNVEVLVVAGGGGGDGGGGGGGGLLYNASLAVGAQAYSLTVGAGGAAPSGSNNTATSGSDSVFASLTATGGGAGRYSVSALAGGSGGGGPSSASGTGGLGVSGQGKAGGSGVLYGGGGGGGAAEAGGSGSSGVGGAGGTGLPYSISGTPAYYSGGGGGGYSSGGSGGAGGSGGGGSGASGSAGSGTANTGGGGGGVYNSYPAGAGGSGIVIIRYPIISGLIIPTITSVNPASGQQGTPITIIGAGFATNASVTIGVAAATDVSWVSATEIRAKAPVSPASGAAVVTVTNPTDKSYGVKTDGFTYSQVALQSLASALNGTNSGSNNLAGMRDGLVVSYAGYSLNGYENNWSYGYDFALSYTVTSIRFYSIATSERVRYFLIEQWNGSAWVKVPINSWSDGATAYNSTEGQAANANGWNSVTFAPVSASKFRIRFTSSWNVGDENAGLSEMEMYGY